VLEITAMMRRALLVACGLFALTPLTVAIARNARGEGRVQWIAGTKMSVIPRTGGPPFSVDLGRVLLEQYTGVREGHPIRIEGVLSVDGRRVIATAVEPLEGWKERVDGQPLIIPRPLDR
jgi:hypothetical protein